jgi:hypothetical protein
MSNENYYEQIARLQAAANESLIADRTNQVNALAHETLELWEQAREADREGDAETALELSKQAGERTAEWQQVMAQLPQQPQQLSETKLNWMQQRGDLVNDPRFQPLATFYHDWVTKQMAVPEDSPAYVELMSKALEPDNYKPTPTPDDIVHELQTNSKYANLGGRFTPQEYNRQVQRLIYEKQMGWHQDR